jgi:hypothetical protein
VAGHNVDVLRGGIQVQKAESSRQQSADASST